MFCKHCGKQIRESAKFCGSCGNPAAIEAPPKIPAQQTPPEPHPEQQSGRVEHTASTAESPTRTNPVQEPHSVSERPSTRGKHLLLALGVTAVLLIGIATFSLKYLKIGPRASDYPTASAALTSTAPPVATATSRAAKAPLQAASDIRPHATSSAASACFDLSKREPHSLDGKLVSAIFADQPNFSDVRKGDDAVGGYLLQLDNGICIQEDNSEYRSADPNVQISEVQLIPKDWDLKIEAAMRSLLGYKVRIELASAQSAMTGHDHRPLVAQVEAIVGTEPNAVGEVIPRTMSPRTFRVGQEQEAETAATTVRAFFEALSFGNGEAASGLVIPEKRSSGPYAPASISHFYGPLPEPLRLVELKPQGANEFLVTYTFATSTRRCQSRAVVTTTQRDSLNLIEKIHELENCGVVSSNQNSSVASSTH